MEVVTSNHAEEDDRPHEKTMTIKSKANPGKTDYDHMITYPLMYQPPWYMAIIYGWQVVLPIIAKSVTVAMVAADVVCADASLRAKLMATTIFVGGFSTFVQCTIGVRLPLFQGPSLLYLVPLMVMSDLPEWTCPDNSGANATAIGLNATDLEEVWRPKVLSISGSLVMVSVLHTVIGFSGVVGIIVRYIGPMTIVPFMVLGCIIIGESMLKFAEIHWGIASLTVLTALICSAYMGNMAIPILSWSRSKGCYIKKQRRLLRTFAIFLSMLLGWLFSFILTAAGALTDDPKNKHYQARTDAQLEMIDKASWFYFPYPGQFGMPQFHTGVFFALLVAMFSSITDSVSDYLACSQVCQVHKPPASATNRGLVIEGFLSILSGAFGACHATTTSSGHIGALALTGVACRIAFTIAGVILMIIGVLGKFMAFLVSIPRPVIAGTNFVTYGSLLGTSIGMLQTIDMGQPRNIVSLGFAIVLGRVIPIWVRDNREETQTGIVLLDEFIFAMIGTPLMIGPLVGFILDNTLPGMSSASVESHVMEPNEEEHADSDTLAEDPVYDPPFIGAWLRRRKWTKYIPISPGFSWSAICTCRRKHDDGNEANMNLNHM